MKKNAKDKVPQKGGRPFFAKLLEAQELEKVAGGHKPPHPGPVTKKYPSDNDDDPVFVTLKFPSDSDENGCS